MFHIPEEVKHPEVSFKKNEKYHVTNLKRGFAKYPSLEQIHHITSFITKEQYEDLKEKFPHLVVEGVGKRVDITRWGLAISEWIGKPKNEWIEEYKPLLAKITTPEGDVYVAGFEPDYDW